MGKWHDSAVETVANARRMEFVDNKHTILLAGIVELLGIIADKLSEKPQ